MSHKSRKRSASIQVFTNKIEHDSSHHLAGSFMPQTPLGSRPNSPSPAPEKRKISPFLNWIVDPATSIKLVLLPLVLYANWELLTPLLARALKPWLGPYPGDLPNPFGSIFLISHKVESSSPEDPRYQKGWLDLVFMAYYVIVWSFVREIIVVKIFGRIARYFGLRTENKLARFGEQGYAVVYFAFMGIWGYRIMGHLPTFWYKTEHFWLDYPHWDMIPDLKRYYMMQMAYWIQQLLVLALGLEKPRKDYYELIAHHLITLWLVGWSYLMNLTLIGNAVYLSMDIPDAVFAFSKILNYIQYERAKVVSFVIFIGVWTYFRHAMNIYILISVWTEYKLVPEAATKWIWAEGVYMTSWIKYQIFGAILFLQILNLFWYYLILRILVRAVITSQVDDDRSDDEGDNEDEKEHEKND